MTHLLGNYKRFDLVISRGKGAYAYSKDGRTFLDFTSGVATNCLGHAHPSLQKALKNQAKKVWHTSNLFYNEPANKLAETLVKSTFPSKVFFCNSGTEANEAIIKIMRRFWFDKGQTQRNRIITFSGSFHGRTIASMSATNNPAHIRGFAPLLEGFDFAEFGNLESVKKLINDNTAGVLIEPIQGEGGVNFAGFEFLEQLDALCKEKGILLGLDEVQSGIYRTGKLFAYQFTEIKPDLVGFAKGIGGGFPLGGCIVSEDLVSCMDAGSHGSTFGGNPLACAVALEVLKVLSNPSFLKKIDKLIKILDNHLIIFQQNNSSIVKEVRGFGLLRGLKLSDEVSNYRFVESCLQSGLLVTTAGNNVVRILPPLIAQEKHVKEMYKKMLISLKNL